MLLVLARKLLMSRVHSCQDKGILLDEIILEQAITMAEIASADNNIYYLPYRSCVAFPIVVKNA